MASVYLDTEGEKTGIDKFVFKISDLLLGNRDMMIQLIKVGLNRPPNNCHNWSKRVKCR